MKNVKPGHAKPIVCLDAGHYGKYNRSPVVKNYYESDMVWKLHNYLATELEGYGIQVKKTRSSQAKDLELYSRGKASAGCDLFISLHSNACGTESVDRPEGICLVDDDCGAIDAQSCKVAAILADVVREVMQTKDKAQTYSRKCSYDRDEDGKKNDDYYGVLYGAHQAGTAGVILEHSFHTNARAAKWLLDDANLRKLAKAEAKALAAWFDVEKASAPAASSAPNKVTTPAQVALDKAKQFNKEKAGTYMVSSSDGSLNLRAGAGKDKALIETMKNGTKVKCYGYYTDNWLYVVSAAGNTGYCHAGYLEKV